MKTFSVAELFKCAEDAIARSESRFETNNKSKKIIHNEFAAYFFEKAGFQKDKFLMEFNKYIPKINSLKPMYKDLRSPEHKEYSYKGKKPSVYYKWVSEEENSMPDRDAVVQMGIHIGLDVSEVDQLLVSLGKRKLYVINPYDMVGIFCLECFKDENISGEEKINEYKRLMVGIEKDEYVESIGQGIESSIKEALKQINAQNREIRLDTYNKNITIYLKEKMAKNIKNVEEVIREYQNIISTEMHYSYYSKIKTFIDRDDKYEKYILTNEVKKSCISSRTLEEILDKEYNVKDKEKRTIEEKLRQLHIIWTQDIDKKGSKLTTIRDLYNGRFDHFEKIYVNKSEDVLFGLYKLCIVTGREDEIGEFLKATMYQDYNLNALLTAENQSKRYWEKVESLIAYTLIYRDMYIERFYKNEIEKKSILRERFPFIDLIKEISNELMKILGDMFEQEDEETSNWFAFYNSNIGKVNNYTLKDSTKNIFNNRCKERDSVFFFVEKYD